MPYITLDKVVAVGGLRAALPADVAAIARIRRSDGFWLPNRLRLSILRAGDGQLAVVHHPSMVPYCHSKRPSRRELRRTSQCSTSMDRLASVYRVDGKNRPRLCRNTAGVNRPAVQGFRSVNAAGLRVPGTSFRRRGRASSRPEENRFRAASSALDRDNHRISQERHDRRSLKARA